MTDREVAGIIEEFRVPLHVRRHCAAVANFAVEIGRKLVRAGVAIDLTLLRHAALLHDFVRVVDFKIFEPLHFPDLAKKEDIAFWEALREKYKGMHHAKAGAQILKELGYPEIARLVGSHGFLQIEKDFDTWEQKVLYYADKRTKHDKVVSLKERLEDGHRRNAPGISNQESAELNKKVYALEKEILTMLEAKKESC